jgi:protein-disulfide isomerase
MDTDENAQGTSLMPVAFAIVFAGALIALSVYLVFKPAPQVAMGPSGQQITVPEITESDHILGNPDAPIKIIEYSDLDCQFCRTFHATMKQVMAIYGANGTVAWVYRHFPLVELHPNAPKLAEASECVADIGGNDAFWKFIDSVFTSQSLNGQFDMSKLETSVAVSGVPVQQFRECLDSGKFRTAVAQQFDEAVAAGGTGTPYTLILSPNEAPIPIAGSRAYATIKEIIDAILAR